MKDDTRRELLWVLRDGGDSCTVERALLQIMCVFEVSQRTARDYLRELQTMQFIRVTGNRVFLPNREAKPAEQTLEVCTV